MVKVLMGHGPHVTWVAGAQPQASGLEIWSLGSLPPSGREILMPRPPSSWAIFLQLEEQVL